MPEWTCSAPSIDGAGGMPCVPALMAASVGDMLWRMWNDLLSLGVSAPEKILRTVVIYLVLAVLLRLAGKRDLAQLNSFDLVVMLLLSNVVQNAVIGPDNSLLGGLHRRDRAGRVQRLRGARVADRRSGRTG